MAESVARHAAFVDVEEDERRERRMLRELLEGLAGFALEPLGKLQRRGRIGAVAHGGPLARQVPFDAHAADAGDGEYAIPNGLRDVLTQKPFEVTGGRTELVEVPLDMQPQVRKFGGDGLDGPADLRDRMFCRLQPLRQVQGLDLDDRDGTGRPADAIFAEPLSLAVRLALQRRAGAVEEQGDAKLGCGSEVLVGLRSRWCRRSESPVTTAAWPISSNDRQPSQFSRVQASGCSFDCARHCGVNISASFIRAARASSGERRSARCAASSHATPVSQSGRRIRGDHPDKTLVCLRLCRKGTLPAPVGKAPPGPAVHAPQLGDTVSRISDGGSPCGGVHRVFVFGTRNLTASSTPRPSAMRSSVSKVTFFRPRSILA